WRRSGTWNSSVPGISALILLASYGGGECLPSEWSGDQSGSVEVGTAGYKVISLNIRSNTHGPIAGSFYAYDLAAVADIDFTVGGNPLRQSEDELDFTTDFKLGFGKKVQSAIADIAGAGRQVAGMAVVRKNAHWQAHGKSSRFATFSSVRHRRLR